MLRKIIEWKTQNWNHGKQWAPGLISSLIALLLTATTLMATSGSIVLPYQETQALKKAQALQPLEVLILEHPLSYLKDLSGTIWGIDYERLLSFSRYTGLKVKTQIFKTPEALLAAYRAGKGQIVISRLPLEQETLVPGPYFEEIRKGLFCNKLVKIEKSEQVESIQFIDASWPFKNIIRLVLERKKDCFVSEWREGIFASQPYVQIMKVGELPTSSDYTWYIRDNRDELYDLLSAWQTKASRSGEFTNIDARFEMTLLSLKNSDVRSLQRELLNTFPQYHSAFKEVAQEVKLPWALIAGVAYQESKWNHTATSFTGVKGLMQLTQQTASHMGVSDREDPFQSIWGGARYLKHLWEEWVEIRNPQDRLMITLASYNAGIGHIFDVMEIVRKEGRDPYQWKNIEAALPRLEEPGFCEELPYGCSRGTETVEFVKRSYSFYQLLSVRR